jgi:hypothetical protein
VLGALVAADELDDPSHTLADLKLKWRELRMSADVPRAGSSPAAQQALGLNDDATWTPSKTEADKHGDR